MNQTMTNAIETLKKALAESEELKAYNAAKAAYDADTELNKLINEYNIQALLLEQEGKKPENEKDDNVVSTISARLREIYETISENKSLANLRDAENGVSDIVNAINDAVRFTIDPESANCTHDCSTCGGCH